MLHGWSLPCLVLFSFLTQERPKPLTASIPCLCWDSQAHWDSGEGDGRDLALHWRDFTLTFGRRVLHGCTAHRFLVENTEALLECDCRGEQVLSWAVACPIREILIWNSPGHCVLIWTGLLEGLVSSKVLLVETWHCNYWLVKWSKIFKPAFVWPAKTRRMDLLF